MPRRLRCRVTNSGLTNTCVRRRLARRARQSADSEASRWPRWPCDDARRDGPRMRLIRCADEQTAGCNASIIDLRRRRGGESPSLAVMRSWRLCGDTYRQWPAADDAGREGAHAIGRGHSRLRRGSPGEDIKIEIPTIFSPMRAECRRFRCRISYRGCGVHW